MRIDHRTDMGANSLYVRPRLGPTIQIREDVDRRETVCDVALRSIVSVELDTQYDIVEQQVIQVILNLRDEYGTRLRVLMHSDDDLLPKLAALICGEQMMASVTADEVSS